MPATIDAPPAAATSPDTGIAQGAPSTGAKPSSFRPPNPAFERFGSRLQSRANKAAGLPAPPEPKPEIKSETAKIPDPGETSPKPSVEPVDDGTETDKPKTENAQVSEEATDKTGSEDVKPGEEKGKKVSAWKLVEQYKKTSKDWQTKAESAEAELTKIRAGTSPQAQTEELQQRLEAAEKRLKEYEDEIRFTKFEKHPEFQEKYAKPYEQAWKRATSELAEVSVTDPATGAVRAATAEDMLALVNLPLGKAREYSDQLFGAFSNDAMGHRKAIKELFEKQQEALKEAREKGGEREKQMVQQTQAQQAALNRELGETWQQANQQVVADKNLSKYLTPVEGDKEWNEVLEKAKTFSDGAFANDPRNPNLTPEQRKEAVRMHAAMRNRSIMYGPQRVTIKRQEARIAELEKLLEEFNASEPTTGGSSTKSNTPPAPARFEERFKSKLQKMAR